MIEIYEKYLENISKSLDKFFEQQKPYVFCKEGCSICCETGEYPFSRLEFEYAMVGYNNLSEDKKNLIRKKAEEVKKNKNEFAEDKKFMHSCPFLIEHKCSIYKYRGLICRNHGLMYFDKDKDDNQTYTMPHCVDDGLNYSNVYDKELHTITSEKWEETGIEQEPVSYNIGIKFLTNNNTTKELGLDFGESKALIDWF